MVSKPVEVKVMDIRWLVKDKKAFFDLTPFLKQQDNEKLYQADFIKSLTFEYWGDYQVNVILWLQLPWIVYSILCLAYFSEVLSMDGVVDTEGDSWPWDVVAVAILISTIYLMVIEIRQI